MSRILSIIKDKNIMKSHFFKELNLTLNSNNSISGLSKYLVCLRKTDNNHSKVVFICNKEDYKNNRELNFFIAGEIEGDTIIFVKKIGPKYPYITKKEFYVEYF